MKREKLADKVARLERELVNAEASARWANKLAKDKTEALDNLLKACNEGQRPDGLLRRLANAVAEGDQDPGSLSWDDVCQIVGGWQYERASFRQQLRDLAMKIGVSLDNVQRFTGVRTPRTDLEVLDAIDTEVGGMQEAKETLEALPTGWEEWKDLMASTMSPADVDAMVELLDLLGFSGTRLACVLASPDMAGAIKRY